MSPEADREFSVIVRTVARSVVRVMLIFGFYIVLHGQITHGDGFAGGVIIALAFVMLLLVFGEEIAWSIFSRPAATRLGSLGALGLLAIAALGFTGGYFFYNFLGRGQAFQFWSGGIIPVCNIAIGVLASAALFGIYAALSLFTPDSERKP